MLESDLLTMFRRSGALLEGHFRLSSGLHSPGYLQCALVLQHPRDAGAIGAAPGRPRSAAGRDLRAVARARRHRDRPGSGACARHPRPLCRAPGRDAHAAPRVRALAGRPGARRRGRGDDGGLDARDDAGGSRGWRSGRRRVRDGGPKRRQSRPRCPFAALLPFNLPTYRKPTVPCAGRAFRSSSRAPRAA